MGRDAKVARHMQAVVDGKIRHIGIGDNGGPPLDIAKATQNKQPFSPLSVLTEKQLEARAILFGSARHVMLYGGSRCVSGDTVLDGHTKTIAELAADGKPVQVVTSWGVQWAEAPFLKGYARLVMVQLASGRSIRVTPDHRFWTGIQWVRAETLSVGDVLAVRTSDRTLLQSTQDGVRQASRAGGQSSTRTLLGSEGRCSSDPHRYGQQLPQAEVAGLACRASRYGGLARTLSNPFQHALSLLWRVSGSRTGRPYPLGAVGSRFDQLLFRPSTLGAIQPSCTALGEAALASERTYEPFHGIHQGRRQSQTQCGLRGSSDPLRRIGAFLCAPSRVGRETLTALAGGALSRVCARVLALRQGSLLEPGKSEPRKVRRGLIARAVHSVLHRCAAASCLSSDTPFSNGYDLDKVTQIVTLDDVEGYYTLHVPTAEQYFANGILHHNSGKSFIALYAVVKRALSAPNSRHAIFRHRFNHLKRSIGLDTLPKVMSTCFPGVAWKLDKTDWFVKLTNGAEIWLGGLDDKERTEKILGMEFVTLYFNECSQIGHHAIRMARTRLAQKCGIPLRAYYDANPPSRAHWSYSEFIEFKNPIDKEPLNKALYDSVLMNPGDNLANIPPEYIEELQNLPLRDRLRFLEGKFASDDATMLWTYESIKRVKEAPQLDDVCVAVDPSGTEAGDEVGIVVVGRAGREYYVLADGSLKATPQQWAKKAVELYDRPDILADSLVCESNFGGDMVEFTIKQVARNMHKNGLRESEDVNYRRVVSSRGKVLRAEPVSAIYESGRVFHVGTLAKLEDEMTQFKSDWDRKANGSPNRVDALVFAITHLMNKAPSTRPMIFGSVNIGR